MKMYILLKMVMFQPAMLDYQRVILVPDQLVDTIKMLAPLIHDLETLRNFTAAAKKVSFGSTTQTSNSGKLRFVEIHKKRNVILVVAEG